ncbi:MAG: guanylate kinase [Bacteroidales bacterium]|nr:guanylate kinase [Bacteroidales bacterium]
MEGKLIIFSAPSGSGKTTIVKKLLAMGLPLSFSISATSRSRRKGEQDGKDYYFFSVEEFKQKIQQDAFLEWEEVYDNKYYGTLKSELDRIWRQNKHVVFDVDVKGGINIKNKYPCQSLSVFIMPPSLEELKNRLLKRGSETESSLKHRLDKASYEISFAGQFDKIIKNDDLEQAVQETCNAIIEFLQK